MTFDSIKLFIHSVFYRFHLVLPKKIIWRKLHCSNYHPEVSGIVQRIEASKQNPELYSIFKFYEKNLDMQIEINGKSVLEIGHGGVWFLAEVLESGGFPTGIEIANVINDRSNQALRELGYTDFSLHLGNGKDLTVVSGQRFDLIFANTVIQHLPTKVLKSYLKNIKELLDHDGIAILQVLETKSNKSTKRLSRSDLFSVAYAKHEFIALVKQCGLKLVKFSDFEYWVGKTYWSIYVLNSN